jgi:hypothetical protein
MMMMINLFHLFWILFGIGMAIVVTIVVVKTIDFEHAVKVMYGEKAWNKIKELESNYD